MTHHPLLTRAQRDRRVPPAAFVVLSHLITLLTDGPCDVYQDALATTSRLHVKTVRGALRLLVGRRYVAVVGRGARRSLRLELVADIGTDAPRALRTPLDGTQHAA